MQDHTTDSTPMTIPGGALAARAEVTQFAKWEGYGYVVEARTAVAQSPITVLGDPESDMPEEVPNPIVIIRRITPIPEQFEQREFEVFVKETQAALGQARAMAEMDWRI